MASDQAPPPDRVNTAYLEAEEWSGQATTPPDTGLTLEKRAELRWKAEQRIVWSREDKLSLLDALDSKDREQELLCELLCESAPLAWVAGSDMDGAREWEKRTHDALNRVGYTGASR